MTHDSSRWLVTINGRVPTENDLVVLHQTALAEMVFDHGEYEGIVERAEFADKSHAVAFHEKAAHEFPEDDVRLWTSVDTDRQERA